MKVLLYFCRADHSLGPLPTSLFPRSLLDGLALNPSFLTRSPPRFLFRIRLYV